MNSKTLHTIILLGVTFGLLTAALVLSAGDVLGWPGQATVIVTVKNSMSEQLDSEAILTGPNDNEISRANVSVPSDAQQTFIMATNSTNIPGGDAFKICVEESCQQGVNGPPLKPENITITVAE